jgi:hypothetical protein
MKKAKQNKQKKTTKNKNKTDTHLISVSYLFVCWLVGGSF